MKKILPIIILASLLTITAKSQIRRQTDSTQNVVSNSSKKSERLESRNSFNLTNQQLIQLKEFRRTVRQQRDLVNNDQSLIDEQKKRKLKDLRIEQKEKLNRILTPEQIEKLKAERMKAGMDQGIPNQADKAE